MIVTTTSRPTPAQVERARAVAARCGVPFRRRRGPLPLDDDGLAYVVGRDRDALRSADRSLSVHLGLLHARRHAGLAHPLIAALAPSGTADTIVDATLGLAADALHIAAVLDCRVVGIEGSPAIYSLLEEGLPRLARKEPAAARVAHHHGDATEVLGTLPAQSADAVYLSPMFADPRDAVPGFELLRALAVHAPLDRALLAAACRVGRRVVVKVEPGLVLPVGRELDRVRGRAVDYVVVSTAEPAVTREPTG